MVRRIDKQSFGYGMDPANAFEKANGNPSQRMVGTKALEKTVEGVYLNGARIHLDDPEVQYLIEAGGEDLLLKQASEMPQSEVDEKFADIIAQYDDDPIQEPVNTFENEDPNIPPKQQRSKWNDGRKSPIKK